MYLKAIVRNIMNTKTSVPVKNSLYQCIVWTLLLSRREKLYYGECILKTLFEIIWIRKQVQKLNIFKNNVSLKNPFSLSAKKFCYGECNWKPLLEIYWMLKQVQQLSIFYRNA